MVWEAVGAPAGGVRLRPGTAGAVLGVPPDETSATRPEAADPSARLRLLTEAVLQRRAEPDRLVGAAVRRLAVPDARVSAVAQDLGVSERHLNRRVTAAVGYGPTFLARVAHPDGGIELPPCTPRRHRAHVVPWAR